MNNYFFKYEPEASNSTKEYFVLRQIITDEVKASKQYKAMIKELIDKAELAFQSMNKKTKLFSKLLHIEEPASTLLMYEYFKPIEEKETDISSYVLEKPEKINWYGDGYIGERFEDAKHFGFIEGTEQFNTFVYGLPNRRNRYFHLD